jgi:hypothetical protein
VIYASGYSHAPYSQAPHPTPRPHNTQPATHACSGKVKVSLCKCDPADVFNLLKQQFCAIHDTLTAGPSIATDSFLSPDDSGGLSWKLEKLGLIKQQIHVGFSIMYQALTEVLLECAAVFTDVRLSAFASPSSAPPSVEGGGGAAAGERRGSGCGLLCKIVAGAHGLVRHCQGTFSLFCFHTGIIQINACNNSSLVDVQLLANNLHAFFSFFRHRIEPPTPAQADGSRRKRPPPSWAADMCPQTRTKSPLPEVAPSLATPPPPPP